MGLYPENVIEDSDVELDIEFKQKRSYEIDFNTMTFKKDSKGKCILLDEMDSLRQWCQLALLTDRSIYIAYDERFGIDKIIGTSDRKLVQLEIERTVTEALTVHPLINNVIDFKYEWKDESCYYTFEVISTLGNYSMQETYEMR